MKRASCFLAIAFAMLTAALPSAAGSGATPGRPVSVVTTLTPTTVLFGDVVKASVATVVDQTRVNVGSLRLQMRFAPYTATLTKTRSDNGAFSEVRYTLTLHCLTTSCVPHGQSGIISFAPSRLSFVPRGRSDARQTITLSWPKVEVLSRINPAEFAAGPGGVGNRPTVYTFHLTPLPAVAYRFPPSLLIGAEAFLAACLLAATVLLTTGYLRQRRPVVEFVPKVISPRERGLAYVRLSRSRADETERRKALARASAELIRGHAVDLSFEARSLAWSSASPTDASIDALVRRIEEDSGA
jgi:hypothetical protein